MADKVGIEIDVEVDGTGQVKVLSQRLKEVDANAKAVAKTNSTLASSFKAAIPAIAGMAVLNKVNTYAKESIELAKRQIQAERMLEQQFGSAASSLSKYAAELQKKTTYGDEAIIEAQALLGAYVKEEEAIKKLTPAILDLAAAKGMDLKTAADLVAKSVGSSTNAMSRYGVEIEGASGSTERIQSAIDGLTEKFGGMAQAIADTPVGHMEQLENELGDLREELGEELLPVVIEFQKLQVELATSTKDIVVPAISGLAKVVALVAESGRNWETVLDRILFDNTKLKETWQSNEESVKGVDKALRGLAAITLRQKAMLQETGEKTSKFTEDYEKLDSVIQKHQNTIQSLTGHTAVYNEKLRLWTVGGKSLNDIYEKANGSISVATSKSESLSKETNELNKEVEKLTRSYGVMTVELPKYMTGQDKLLSNIMSYKSDMIDMSEKEKQAILETEEVRLSAMIAASDAALTFANTVSNVQSINARKEREEINSTLNARIDAIKKSTMSEKDKERAISKYREEARKENYEIELSEWRRSIAMIQVNAAAGMIKAWQNPGYPGAIPLTIAIGAASTAATATAMANKPKYYYGSRDSAGSYTEIGGNTQGDVIDARVRSGEVIVQAGRDAEIAKAALNGNAVSTNTTTIGDIQVNVQNTNATPEDIREAVLLGVSSALERGTEDNTINWNRILNRAGVL